ncbi:MAG: ABC transporter ATP-binding protein/permease [Lachnospiraceae bacterium]|nr:ABC transporter ATP-binding protein/permease [Lachnospiraceae bacterium]
MKKNGTIRKLLNYIGKYKVLMALSMLMGLIRVASALYLPILTAYAIDYMVDKGKVDFAGIKKYLVIMAVCIVITVISQWIMGLLNNHVTYNVIENLRNDSIKKIQRIPLRILDKFSSGDLLNRMGADCDQVGDGLLLGFSQGFVSLFTIIITLVFMIKLNWIITLVVVLLTPISFFVASFISKRSYNMYVKQSLTRSEQTAFINEILPNEQIVHGYSYEDRAIERFDEINDRLSEYSLKATFFSSITNPATRFVNNLVYAAVGILGVIFVIKGHITVGVLSGFLSYANQYTKPFNDITSVMTELQNAIACAGRIFEFLELEEEDEDLLADNLEKMGATEKAEGDSKSIGKNGSADDKKLVRTENSDGEKLAKNESADGNKASFENAKALGKKSNVNEKNTEILTGKGVTFGYDKDYPILKDLDFSVYNGRKCAIVGPTGCGKTTIINLIMRFYDLDAGHIYLEGDDIEKISKKLLRKKVGMVLQDTWLSHGTIADNISFGKPDATREEIINAAKSCYAHSFIKRLPNGYDTEISESGNNLSRGQKQLLCIARVMLVKPEVLILDEATSNIDTLTEVKVVKAFDKLMEGRTSLIVAHRLQTIQNADCIFVLNGGKIVEEGRHEELLSKSGFYAGIYNSQFV